jgi:hypothetical protein
LFTIVITRPQGDRPAEFPSCPIRRRLGLDHFPPGHGGLGLPGEWQVEVDGLFDEAGAPENSPQSNGIGLGMAGPTILAFGTEEQKQVSCGRCGRARTPRPRAGVAELVNLTL